jgi:two-component system sensor histidine kinase RegB
VAPSDTALPDQINYGWLIRLRWSMVAGQLATILGVQWMLGVQLPLRPLLLIIGLEVASNVIAAALGRRRPARQAWLAGVMACDVVMCTGLLFFTGGPANPFSFLYLVQIALAATTLNGAWTWALTALALGCSGVLFLWHRPLPVSHELYMDLHLRGMWVAFGVAASFIVYFLLRIRRALAGRDAELAASRRLAARQERLASLATLAAGAAHELSTPLGTIAVVMTELQRRAATLGADAEAMEDLRLVRGQVDRCRAILERMSSEAGETVGEGPVATPLAALIEGALADLPPLRPVQRRLDAETASWRLRVPPRAFGQALRGLVKNAQEASPPGAPVSLTVVDEQGVVAVEVSDRGPGIPAAVLERVGEPFFTTKATGKGMGLGIFLARTTLERLGGSLRISSSAAGTRASLVLPADVVERAEKAVARP